MNTRDKIINHALNISCKIYNADKKYVTSNNNRYSTTIKAKRMFLYYLYEFIEKETYDDVKKSFNNFMTEMRRFNVYGGGFYEKRMEIKKLLNELNTITNEKN